MAPPVFLAIYDRFGEILSQFFKNLLLQNRLTDLVQIWFVDTYGDVDLNLFKLGRHDLISRNGTNTQWKSHFRLLLRKATTDLVDIWHGGAFGRPLPSLLKVGHRDLLSVFYSGSKLSSLQYLLQIFLLCVSCNCLGMYFGDV